MSGFFFYPLFPGEAAFLLIAGGHGGSNVEEYVGTAVSLLINILVCFAVFELIMLLRRRMKGRRPTL